MTTNMKERTITVIVCRVGEGPVVEDMANTLQAMQGLVGGYVEEINVLPGGLVMFANEDGLPRRLPYNRSVCGVQIVGDFFVCRSAGSELASIVDGDLDVVKVCTK